MRTLSKEELLKITEWKRVEANPKESLSNIPRYECTNFGIIRMSSSEYSIIINEYHMYKVPNKFLNKYRILHMDSIFIFPRYKYDFCSYNHLCEYIETCIFENKIIRKDIISSKREHDILKRYIEKTILKNDYYRLLDEFINDNKNLVIKDFEYFIDSIIEERLSLFDRKSCMAEIKLNKYDFYSGYYNLILNPQTIDENKGVFSMLVGLVSKDKEEQFNYMDSKKKEITELLKLLLFNDKTVRSVAKGKKIFIKNVSVTAFNELICQFKIIDKQ